MHVINLTYAYNTPPLFSGLNVVLHAGEILQIVGENGRGKTTVLRVLAGLLVPTQGCVMWEGERIDDVPYSYRKNLVYVGHSLGLKSHLTAKENVLLATHVRGYVIEARQVMAVLHRLGLENQAQQPVHQLSAGQKQRLAWACVLGAPSRLWILDEPFSVLSQSGQHLIGEIMANYLAEGGRIIFTSHHAVPLTGIEVKILTL